MRRNYLTTALRALRRHRGYTAINVAGLAVGIASCLLILLYVRDELSYDRYHTHADRIYRVASAIDAGTETWHAARTPHPLAPELEATFPEVEAAVRFRRQDAVLRRDGALFTEERFYFADPAVFDVFTFPMHEGDPRTALTAPFSLVLTETAARTYFGDARAIGQRLTVEGMGEMTVTGVVTDVPRTSHFVFDFLASYATLAALRGDELQYWDNAVASTYVLLRDGQDPRALEAKLPALIAAHFGPDPGTNAWSLDPLTRLYLYDGLMGELGTGSDARYLYVFSSIALFILLLAGINFTSLTTARATERVREVGLRKVLGAERRQLIQQFLGEAVVLALLALVLALMLVEPALPAFNTLTAKEVALDLGTGGWALLLGGGLAVGLLAGVYPAFVLSSFRPALTLKGQATPYATGAGIRKTLVVVQFGISIVLLVGTFATAEQMAYLQNKDLGFAKDRVVVIPLQDDALRARYESLKADLAVHPGVAGAAASYHTPGLGLGVYQVEAEGVDEPMPVQTYVVDHDYLALMGMEVAAGRGFSQDFATDATEAFLVNEAAARRFGWDDPLGKRIVWDGEKAGTVIGVVRDFHVASLHQPIEPLVLHMDPAYLRRLSVRLHPDDIPGTLAFLKATFEQADPKHPFGYTFVDEDFARYYVTDLRTARLVRIATFLAVFVACLGLLGLASFATQRRTKEIGIRKVLGASIPSLLALLARDFVGLVLIAFVIAVPVAYSLLHRWLADFAYRIEISGWIFLCAGLTALLVAVLTVGYQALRTALANPVHSLRSL